MRLIILIYLAVALLGCNTYKRAQKNIHAGNFDAALTGMIKKYKKGNIKEKHMVRWVDVFNNAYTTANSRNIDNIYQANYLEEGSKKYRIMYNNYISLQSRYDKLKPYLPIRVNNKIIPIKHENYYVQLEAAKGKLADALHIEAENLMTSGNKFDARIAYDKYSEVSALNPNYPGIQEKVSQSYNMGLTHILVRINNDSRSVLPRNLHNDITYFHANNQNYFWQKFHINPNHNEFEYLLELNFREINLSPEFVDRNVSFHKREWIDSSEYVTDRKGRRMKDSNGMAIRKYIKRTAKCKVVEVVQSKSAFIQSEFLVFDKNQQLVQRVSPVESKFDFGNTSYTIKGDRDALTKRQLREMRHTEFMPFPSDEQMVFDCGQDLKNKFTNFIASNISGK